MPNRPLRGADTVRRTVSVRVPARRALPADGPLVVDSATALPGGRQLLRGDEPVRVSVRAPRNARAWLVPVPVPAAAPTPDDAPRTAPTVAPMPIAMVDAGAVAATLPSTAAGDAATLWVADAPARL